MYVIFSNLYETKNCCLDHVVVAEVFCVFSMSLKCYAEE